MANGSAGAALALPALACCPVGWMEVVGAVTPTCYRAHLPLLPNGSTTYDAARVGTPAAEIAWTCAPPPSAACRLPPLRRLRHALRPAYACRITHACLPPPAAPPYLPLPAAACRLSAAASPAVPLLPLSPHLPHTAVLAHYHAFSYAFHATYVYALGRGRGRACWLRTADA